MNKSEIQARIEKVESELATLKADLEKCDCGDGIEQEQCWHAVSDAGGVQTVCARTMQGVAGGFPGFRPAYMPECRQVTEEDAALAYALSAFNHPISFAKELHRLGFRMKVTP